MAGKRKPKVAKPKLDDLAKPSKWRLQHGGFSEPIRAADPETGTPVAHRRAVDTLGMMLTNGNITPQMHEAGCIFRTLFRSADRQHVHVAADPPARLDGRPTVQPTTRRASARTRSARRSRRP